MTLHPLLSAFLLAAIAAAIVTSMILVFMRLEDGRWPWEDDAP